MIPPAGQVVQPLSGNERGFVLFTEFIGGISQEFIAGACLTFLLTLLKRENVTAFLGRYPQVGRGIVALKELPLHYRLRPIPCFFLAQIMAFLITDAVIGGEWPVSAELILGGYVWALILLAAFLGIRKVVSKERT